MPLSSVMPRSEDDGVVGVLSQLASDGLTTVLVEYADIFVDNPQAIRDPGQRTDDSDLICPQTTLNVTEAHHVDASHSTFIDIQGNQTNVFSKTTNTYINTRACSLVQRLLLVRHHIDAPILQTTDAKRFFSGCVLRSRLRVSKRPSGNGLRKPACGS